MKFTILKYLQCWGRTAVLFPNLSVMETTPVPVSCPCKPLPQPLEPGGPFLSPCAGLWQSCWEPMQGDLPPKRRTLRAPNPVLERTVPPKDISGSCPLAPVNGTIFGKRVGADGIKFKVR